MCVFIRICVDVWDCSLSFISLNANYEVMKYVLQAILAKNVNVM